MGTHSHGHSHGHQHGNGHSHGHGHGHTHDNIDWSTMLERLRQDDSIEAATQAQIAERLVGLLTPENDQPTVLDIGAGAGGQSVAFALELARRGGGRLVIADAVPELLEAAREAVLTALNGDDRVKVDTVRVDAASDEIFDVVPLTDLVWASRMVHHLPDQQAGTSRLARLVRPGGWLALAEGGLQTRCLPWDLGVGAPGLQDRLLAARDAGFAQMRAEIDGSVRMPYGWNVALTKAGLSEVTSFSVVTDHPAPVSPEVRASVTAWLVWLLERTAERLDADDRTAVGTLLDPSSDAYIGAREDVYLLGATTVYLGRH
ncbi:class I SAM-dependent methyltransferase [Nocardia huaxiensis]|uniref:Class I SAM-dependent methyltransferase n=1 Tax=Nocardia huaxiensis TaxID=2755382 RepID=A0A7D6Z295_9NOCA|nr:class I SAM-dependent methyltransferase [Nocardia huaxiensis]QLY31006.1 class I SAM-dependent methyltransferase [Nocardia huaxiensis]UFS94527.1 class I SAM-dependent methyltransferase [Nocardia huaxiensis]